METSPLTPFGQWLKKRRKSLDLTQEELARRVGCATVTIQSIETNKRRPSKQMARLLAVQLDISIEERSEFIRFARQEPAFHRSTISGQSAAQFAWISRLHRWTNIPLPATPLIGRERDVVALRKLLLEKELRLLTLIGPPGVGKTRLASQVALSLHDAYEEGVYFIPLAPVSDPNLVAAAIAQALGINQVGERSFSHAIKKYLRDKQLLLVLDNFEQVAAFAPFIAELLSECVWLSILVTSRAPLSIRGERHYPVAPLALPDQEDVGVDPNELMRYAAIELFVDRAQAVKPDFVLNPENIKPILAICARLDGLPLAIELVATRINAFPLQMLLEQISGRFLLHAEGLRDVPDRQRTLYHAIDWSYALLSTDQRLLFARLSIFNSGWTLDAAEEIMNDHPGFSTIESLKVLVDNNLAIQLENHGESRFGMLETIREYAAERLAQAGEIERARQNHADYYLALAEKADPFLRTASQKVWLERLDVERGNFRAALTWFVDIRGELEKGLRLAGALGWFWNIRSYVSEGRHWLDKVLLKGKCIQPAIYAKALNVAGSLAWEQSDLARARTYFQESIGLFRDLGPEHAWDLAMALGGYGNVVMYLDDQEALQRAAEESYGLFNQLDDQWGKGLSLCLIGEAHLLKHDYERAYSCFEGATSQLRKTGDRWATGVALMDWGYTNSIQGNLDLARKQLEESIALHREIGERFIQSLSINILAQVEQQQGNNQRAMALYSESLDLLRKMGIEARIADVQYNLAYFVQAHGHYQLASKLYQECLDIYSGQANEEGIAKSKAGLAAITALQT